MLYSTIFRGVGSRLDERDSFVPIYEGNISVGEKFKLDIKRDAAS
jgi:hypothetical protein